MKVRQLVMMCGNKVSCGLSERQSTGIPLSPAHNLSKQHEMLRSASSLLSQTFVFGPLARFKSLYLLWLEINQKSPAGKIKFQSDENRSEENNRRKITNE
jgi:hypothetical protein